MSTGTDRVFGVDGNWYLHRVIHTQMFVPEDVAASQARRFLGMICNDAGAVGAKRLAVAFDGWKIFRYKLYADYKGTRTKDKDGTAGVYDHLQYIKDYLGTVGIQVVHKALYEADDILCTWAAIHPNFVGGSKDKDAYQYVRDGMFLYDSSAKPSPLKIRSVDVEEKLGLPPEMCLDYQTLVGDSIDNIPNLMNKDQVKRGLLQYGSIENWAAKSSGMRQWLKKHELNVKLNRKLVRLVPDVKGVGPIPAMVWNDDPGITKGYHEFRKVAASRIKSLF